MSTHYSGCVLIVQIIWNLCTFEMALIFSANGNFSILEHTHDIVTAHSGPDLKSDCSVENLECIRRKKWLLLRSLRTQYGWPQKAYQVSQVAIHLLGCQSWVNFKCMK